MEKGQNNVQDQLSNIIDETNELQLKHVYESAYLIRKSNNKNLFNVDFYGDPTCGIIDPENKWAIVAGSHLTIWTPFSLKTFFADDFRNIHSIRKKNEEIIQILLDPWDKISAIWELNIKTQTLNKIRDFTKYQGEKYVEEVEW